MSRSSCGVVYAAECPVFAQLRAIAAGWRSVVVCQRDIESSGQKHSVFAVWLCDFAFNAVDAVDGYLMAVHYRVQLEILVAAQLNCIEARSFYDTSLFGNECHFNSLLPSVYLD